MFRLCEQIPLTSPQCSFNITHIPLGHVHICCVHTQSHCLDPELVPHRAESEIRDKDNFSEQKVWENWQTNRFATGAVIIYSDRIKYEINRPQTTHQHPGHYLYGAVSV